MMEMDGLDSAKWQKSRRMTCWELFKFLMIIGQNLEYWSSSSLIKEPKREGEGKVRCRELGFDF